MIESTRTAAGYIKLTATAGLLHKIGSDTYVKSIILLSDESPEEYEEVAERPAYTREQYEAKVAELVRERYTASEEFALQRKAINSLSPALPSGEGVDLVLAEYEEYNAYVDQCKQRAKNPALYADA